MTDIFNNENYRYLRGGRVLMVCVRCGVTVADLMLHDQWHESLAEHDLGLGEIVEDGTDQEPTPEQRPEIEEGKS